MKVNQYLVQVIPSSGSPFHAYVGGYNRSDAYLTAKKMYPQASAWVIK